MQSQWYDQQEGGGEHTERSDISTGGRACQGQGHRLLLFLLRFFPPGHGSTGSRMGGGRDDLAPISVAACLVGLSRMLNRKTLLLFFKVRGKGRVPIIKMEI